MGNNQRWRKQSSIIFILLIGSCLVANIAERWFQFEECAHFGVLVLNQDDTSIRDIALSPDDDILLIGTTIGVYLYDMNSLQNIWGQRTLCSIQSVAYHPEGLMIAAGFDNGQVIVWDTETGKKLYRFHGHNRYVYDLTWSPDGTILASAGWDNSSQVWDTNTGKRRFILVGEQPFEQASMQTSMTSAAFSPDGLTLATGHLWGFVTLWDIQTGEHIKTLYLEAAPRVPDIAWNSDGSKIITANSGSYLGSNAVNFWEVETGKLMSTFEWPDEGPESLAVMQELDLLAVAMGHYKNIVLWDLETQESINVLSDHTTDVEKVLFTQEGTRLISASFDEIVIWDVESGDPISVIKASQLPML